MPNPKQRKHFKKAKKRREEKYIKVLDHEHPHNLNIPIKKATAELQELVQTRNYVKIQTQIDECKFIVQQHYIYCDEDIWACGDAIVLNQNPDKTILIKPMCTSTRVECIAHHEGSNQFIAMCPDCGHIQTVLLATEFKCEKCRVTYKHQEVNHFPYFKLPCAYCPVVIGWDKANENKDVLKKFLKLRKHTIEAQMDSEVDSMMDALGGENE